MRPPRSSVIRIIAWLELTPMTRKAAAKTPIRNFIKLPLETGDAYLREGVRRGAFCPDYLSPKAQIESDCCAEVALPSIGPKVAHNLDGADFLSSSKLKTSRALPLRRSSPKCDWP